jgi:hypothetical protein
MREHRALHVHVLECDDCLDAVHHAFALDGGTNETYPWTKPSNSFAWSSESALASTSNKTAFPVDTLASVAGPDAAKGPLT